MSEREAELLIKIAECQRELCACQDELEILRLKTEVYEARQVAISLASAIKGSDKLTIADDELEHQSKKHSWLRP